MTIETGALEQAYAKVEASYAESAATGGATLSATDAIRHESLSVGSKKNREPSSQKSGTPDVATSLPRKQTSSWNLSRVLWEPSGTLGTASNVAKFLKAGMGSQTAPNLATTVASGGSATGATLTSGTGLAVGDIVFVEVTAGNWEATRLKTVVGAAVTFDALTSTPANGQAVRSGVNFKLASNLADSLSIYKYYNAGNAKQAVFGAVVEQLQINIDEKEVWLAFSGPAGRYADSSSGGGTIQSKPASHTTVGSPASGLVGSLQVDAAQFPIISMKVDVTNQLELRNREAFQLWATGIAGRKTKRAIKLTITAYFEDLTLLGKANSVTRAVIRSVVGSASGSQLGLVAPSVEFEIPEVGDDEGPKVLTFEGMAYATSGNDALCLAEG